MRPKTNVVPKNHQQLSFLEVGHFRIAFEKQKEVSIFHFKGTGF